METVKKVHMLFKSRGLSLSAAESCTGGLLSHYLTDLEGASKFFLAGVVSYSAGAKKAVLHVSGHTIKMHGVVSEETAREMAEQVRVLTASDFSVSTTGNLGPDALEGKPKGLVYIAASGAGGTASEHLVLEGDRKDNKEEAALAALKLLIRTVEE